MSVWADIVFAGLPGYLLGALPFGYWAARMAGFGDIRQQGSGNTGATNVWRVAGKIPGIVTLILDIAKGAFAVALARMLVSEASYVAHAQLIAGALAVGGHMYSPFLRFRGGKGVNTALGVFLALLPLESFLALVVFIVTVWLTRYISLGSILAALTLAGLVVIGYMFESSGRPFVFVPVTGLIAIGIVVAHSSNIRRLLNGTENKFSFNGAKKNDAVAR